jgi:hypothetical protein
MLDLMVAGRAADEPLAVYLGMSEDDKAAAPRRERVTAYLTQAGLANEQFSVRVGFNPDLLAPAAPVMARMAKTESGTAEGFKSQDAQQKSAISGGSK